jgi:hypothetical protein
MARPGAKQKLKDLIGKREETFAYLKGLSPSGVELEIMSLATFTFG